MTDTTTDISTLTPEEAGAKLVEMKKAYDGPPPSATPATAVEAGARLDVLAKDPNFLNRLMAGNMETKAEFERLHELIVKGDRVGDVLAGLGSPPEFETTMAGELSTRNTIAAVEALREIGLREDQIRDTLTDTSNYSAEDVATALRAKSEMMGSEEFRARFLRADSEAVRMMATANHIIVQGVKT
jgi:hypothetical protein